MSKVSGIDITPAIIDRVDAKRFGFGDPCVICGAKFNECPHSVYQTEDVIKYVKKLSPAKKKALREG